MVVEVVLLVIIAVSVAVVVSSRLLGFTWARLQLADTLRKITVKKCPAGAQKASKFTYSIFVKGIQLVFQKRPYEMYIYTKRWAPKLEHQMAQNGISVAS